MRYGQQAEAHRVEQLKDGSIGADAQRQRQGGDYEKALVQTEQACAKVEILPSAIK